MGFSFLHPSYGGVGWPLAGAFWWRSDHSSVVTFSSWSLLSMQTSKASENTSCCLVMSLYVTVIQHGHPASLWPSNTSISCVVSPSSVLLCKLSPALDPKHPIYFIRGGNYVVCDVTKSLMTGMWCHLSSWLWLLHVARLHHLNGPMQSKQAICNPMQRENMLINGKRKKAVHQLTYFSIPLIIYTVRRR